MPPPSVCPLTHDARQASRRGHIGKCDRLCARKKRQPPAFTRSAVLGVALLLGVVCSWSPKAIASVTYTYVGNDFSAAAAPYTTSERITGNFTPSAALGDNLAAQTITPLAFSFNDGIETITQANAVFSIFIEFATGPTGAITSWYVGVVKQDVGYSTMALY